MKRCLIVDDSRIIRRVASKIFFELGFEPDEVENGRKALEAVRINMPAVAMVDWDMPVLDGLAFIEEYANYPAATHPS